MCCFHLGQNYVATVVWYHSCNQPLDPQLHWLDPMAESNCGTLPQLQHSWTLSFN